MRIAIAAVAFSFALTAVARPARAQQLWAERSGSAPALAQVPDFSALAAMVSPAVVSISVEQRVKMRRRHGGAFGDPFEFFFRPFGGEIPRQYRNRGLGTGFIIGENGVILTNNHVVEDADSIEVTFELADGSEKKMSATILGTAPEYDVALIQTEEKINVPIAYLGDSDKTQIGDWVMAIGNPFGLSHSVSIGIISAKERRDIMPSGRRGLYDFMQTDASINPGNSGGPLVNMRGEVIGINTAINAAGSGIGFAIPINMVKAMLPDLKAKGKYTRSWIGIKIQRMTAELSQSYGLSRPMGALVSEVVPGSPAANAGITDGDVILEFDGKPVRTSSDLPLYASIAGVGKKVKLKIWHEKRDKHVYVTLSAFPSGQTELAERPTDEGSAELGLTVADITPGLARQFGLDAHRGVVIKEVTRGSAAGRAGLRPGDVVLSLNGRQARNAREFARAVRRLRSGAVMRFQVDRRGGRLFVAIRKP